MNVLSKIYYFYLDGFRNMTVGRNLWILILIKVFIMFAILKVFFFPNVLSKIDDPQEKGDYVIEQLIKHKP